METEVLVKDDEITVSMVEQHVRLNYSSLREGNQDVMIRNLDVVSQWLSFQIHGQEKDHTVSQPGKGMIRYSSQALDPRSPS
jgi:hypothetical protein